MSIDHHKRKRKADLGSHATVRRESAGSAGGFGSHDAAAFRFLKMGLPRVLVLTGPTGVGKTRLSLELARRLHGEIISGDPFQAYRGLDIGTDKVMGAERASVPHHLLDILDPHEPFNVQQFKERCEAAIRVRRRLRARGCRTDAQRARHRASCGAIACRLS